MIFAEKTFWGLLACDAPQDATPPNFTEKTFTKSHKTAKFAKVFSLESFPLLRPCSLSLLSLAVLISFPGPAQLSVA